MQRKELGSVFALFGLVLLVFGMGMNFASADQLETVLGISMVLYASALIISGTMVVLFASNEEVEVSYTYYGIFLAVGITIGGLLSNFDGIITSAFGLVGMASAPLIAFFRSY